MALPPIRFGTSGWRGVLGDGFHLPGVRALALALARELGAPRARPRVVVAHDQRFQAAAAADLAARVLAAAGAEPVRARGAVPTPVACFAVRRRRAAAGLVVTASHNAAEYLGVKVVAASGAPAPPERLAALERRAARLLAGQSPAEATRLPAPVDLASAYRRALAGRLDAASLRRSGLQVHFDALHGTGAGQLDRLLAELGVPVLRLRCEPDPLFGGVAPDPTADPLAALGVSLRRARGLRLGLATDGDADRFVALDARGQRVSETEGVALLVEHLARTGRLRRGVAISIATGSLVERVARAHGLAVERHGIGFRPLAEALASGRVDAAGDESGGFAWGAFGRDKDGILSGALLAERLALEGKPLAAAVASLHRRYGPTACGRTATALDAKARAGLRRLSRARPDRFDGAAVLSLQRRDGLRLTLDDGFVYWRRSGTEPALRVYAEAPDQRRLARRLRAGLRALAG